MLKYVDIIVNLSLDEKLAILTNGTFFSTPKEGLPTFSMTDVDSLNQAEEDIVYPSFQALVNTWDTESVEYVAKQMSKRALDKEMPAVFLPKANIRSNVYSDGASEDPYLLGKMTGKYAKVMENHGVTPILSTCALTDLDVEYADVKPNAKAIFEYYLNSFRVAMKNCDHFAVASAYTSLKGEYEKVNIDFVREMIDRNVADKDAFVFCEKVRLEGELDALKSGYTLCLNGDARVMKEAVDYYNDLLNLVESGEAGVEELETALSDGFAISEDVIDAAVDGVLDFVYRCIKHAEINSKTIDDGEEKKALTLAERSAVLLKNKDNVLPLRSDQKVAVIGQIAKECYGQDVTEFMGKISKGYVGYEDGYDLSQNQNRQLIYRAKTLAQKADVIVLFLGVGKQREQALAKTKCLKLPGCQMELLEVLSSLRKPIVVILKGSGRVDIRFEKQANAIMYAPEMGSFGGRALARLLYGKVSPSGKLPFTIYEDVDNRANTERFYKNHEYNKVGKFIGYRRYDTDRERIKYPFGHGLSYTNFQYSNLRMSGSTVQVTVKNAGTREATNVVQFYYGPKSSADVSPRKELFFSTVVTLKPGQSATIREKLDDTRFSAYNPETKAWETVRKVYRIYVGSSVADDKLYCDYNMAGAKEVKGTEDISEYLQGKSNIKVGGYFMETTIKQGKGRDKAMIIGLAAIILGVLGDLLVLILTGGLDFFHDIIGKWVKGLLLVTFNLLIVLGAVGLITKRMKQASYKKKQAQRIALKRKTDEKEKIMKPLPYEQLFLEEFKDVEEEVKDEDEEDETAQVEAFVIKEETDQYHKNGWSLSDMQTELVQFLATRGIVLDAMNARALLSAMSVSRLVLIQTDKGANREAFVRAVSEFFANEAYVDNTVGYTTSDDLLYQVECGTCYETQFANALTAAGEDSFAIKVAHLMNVDPADIGGFTSQLMRYIVKPDIGYTISTKNKVMCDNSYTLKYNLWVFACLEEDVLVDELPAYIVEPAAFVRLQFAECEQRLDETVRTPISAKQFLDLTAKARRTFELTESQWKRVDKLEEYVQARAHYRISNKLWQKMECYASVFLALGGENDQALDNVMTSKMLLTVLSLIANNRKEDDELFVHVLENIFGDDKINACRMLAEASGVDMSDVTRKEELEKAAQRRAQRLEELAQIKAEKELAMRLALEAAAAEAAAAEEAKRAAEEAAAAEAAAAEEAKRAAEEAAAEAAAAEAVEETAENVATEATETTETTEGTEATEEGAPAEETPAEETAEAPAETVENAETTETTEATETASAEAEATEPAPETAETESVESEPAAENTEATEGTEEAAPVEEKTEETAEVAVAQENSAEGENE